MNAKVITYLVAFAALLLSYFGVYYISDKAGYTRAISEVNVEASKVAIEKAAKQAEDQKSVNHLAHLYQQAVKNEGSRKNEVDKLKSKLRANSVCRNDAIYGLWNESANSPNLPPSGRTREPDGEADGLDAIQYSIAEYNNAASQVNALIDVIRSSECYQ